jgi:hypothetical protein
VERAGASPTCPRCGAASPAGAANCGACGFAIVESADRRRPAPAGARPAALAAAAVAAVGAVLLIGDRDAPRPAPDPVPDLPRPTPISALEAERRLEVRFLGANRDESAAVRCPGRIAPGRTVRCELRYADGIPRALLVRLAPGNELEADVPYPATLRR